MSILKSIMHHWNKTTNSYDTLHPETESAQITDWHSGIMASLASKTLGTVVDAITTDSVLGKLIKTLLDASGVKYLIDTNGYVCFGSLFGGLIIQWGYFLDNTPNNSEVTLPIAFVSALYVVVITDIASGGCPLSYGIYQLSSKSFYAYSRRIYSGDVENVIFGRWIAIGH